MIDLIKKLVFARFRSLKVSMLYALVVGIIMAILTFLAVELAFGAYINDKYLTAGSRSERESEYLEDLQDYVIRHELSSLDTDVLADWVRGNRYLYVMIYKDDQLLLDSNTASKPNVDESDENTDTDTDISDEPSDENVKEDSADDDYLGGGLTVTFPTREDLIEYAKERGTYPIEMTDGIPLLVSLVDYTEYFYYDMMNVIALVVAAVMLILIIMFYFNSLTGRITKLARDVSVVAAGDMDHSLSTHERGRDEISNLACNVENMRCSMLETIAKEREAINSNTELITSMSHDIRTPLTVLLGYIDLMKINAKDEKLSEYLQASENTALRLKQMSDDMFGYFVVFGDEGRHAEIDKYEAHTLFEQIMSEKILLLSEQDYEVREVDNRPDEWSGQSVYVLTDAPKLMRIAENIFSNITKYADKSEPVLITYELNNGRFCIKIENKTLQNKDMVESNGIGLKTCYKLSELIDAGFSAEERDGSFTVTLSLRIAEE